MDLSNFSNANNLNSLDMSSILNTKNKTITGDRFYVGEGILKCDNYFISLDSICMVEIGRRQNSASSFILIIILGIILCVFSLLLCSLDAQMGITGIFIGFLVSVGGFLGLNHIRKSNEKIPYSMSIHLSDNSTYFYYSLDKNFILDIMEVIQSCINDRRGGYNILNNEEKIERIDNSIHIGDNFNGTGDIIGGTGATKNAGNTNTYTTNNNGILPEDWVNLEKFFMMRQNDFPIGDRNYKICSNLAAYSQRKEAGKIKDYLQKIGREGIKMLFSASTNVAAMETVKPIVQKILSLKG